MSPEELIGYRKRADLTQGEMATRLGLSKSAYVAIELNKANLRYIHELAVERVLFNLAAATGDLMLLPLHMRAEAHQISDLFQSQPEAYGKDPR